MRPRDFFLPPERRSMMKIALSSTLVFTFLLSLCLYTACSAHDETPIDSAKSFFEQLNERNYPAVWADLTAKSKETIVSDVIKENRRFGGGYSSDQIMNDFRAGGPAAVAYWKAFLNNFDPDKALRKSTWKLGKAGREEAQVIIKYRRAEEPAVLRMFREEGRWKVGLTETFWTRKIY
jgi:hypothetical protein